MIQVKEAIVVEGKYDKIKLSSILDALIIETHGFQIFKDKEQMDLLRKLANTQGLVVMTDSDSAGFLIRNYLTGSIDASKIKHVYLPDILGKEKRKDKFSKEGKLGVEGMPVPEILNALKRGGVICEEKKEEIDKKDPITKLDLFEIGVFGGTDSSQKRKKLLQELKLPEHLSTNSLVKMLNQFITKDKLYEMAKELFGNE